MLRRILLFLVVLLAAGLVFAGAAYLFAGRGAPPEVAIDRPDPLVGRLGQLDVTAGAPGGRFTELTIVLEQGERRTTLFTLENPSSATIAQASEERLRITRPLGKESVPELQPGPARVVVTAARASFLNLQTLTTTAAKEFEVRLDPPRLAVVSTFHYVNHGGSELVVYRTTPADVASGVLVGDVEYRGYPAAAAGIAGADPSLKVAFFALRHDQDLTTPIRVFARDETGNEAAAPFVDRIFPKPFRRSRIAVDDRFMGRVVPEIVQRAPEIQAPAGDLLAGFLSVNGELRQRNAERIEEITAATAERKLWEGPFAQLGNSKVEAGYADHRTYVYDGREVDQQVHLGFDLAVTARVDIAAANAGRVLSADWLGIYGNCVIIDHGLGVASLYAHLSSIAVKPGDEVVKGQPIGQSGMTGLAGGDHLHFTMLLQGRPVNPVEWWDPQWMADRVARKLSAAATGAAGGV